MIHSVNLKLTTVVVSLDGAYVLMRDEGYREAMVGNISLYEVTGKRLHTVYIGEAPEYGKGTFFQHLEKEIATVKKQYPDALYLGIADGAKNNWPFLERHTSRQLLDFFHVTEYLASVSYAAGFDLDDDEAQAQAEAAERQAQQSAEEEAGLTEKQPPPPPEITPELKQAFRQAAKLMHPDRATTDSERERRNVIMAQVNVAYAKGEQATIDKLMLEFGQDPEAITGEDVAARLIRTIRRIAQLRRRLTESEQEIAIQTAGELYDLMITVTETNASGGDALSDLAQHIMQQISERKIELEMIRQRRVADVNL